MLVRVHLCAEAAVPTANKMTTAEHFLIDAGQIGHGPLATATSIARALRARRPECAITLNTASPRLAQTLLAETALSVRVTSRKTFTWHTATAARSFFRNATTVLFVNNAAGACAACDLDLRTYYLDQVHWCVSPDRLESEYSRLTGLILPRFFRAYQGLSISALPNVHWIGPLSTYVSAPTSVRRAGTLVAYYGGTRDPYRSPRVIAQDERLLRGIARRVAKAAGLREVLLGGAGLLEPQRFVNELRSATVILATPGLGVLHDVARHAGSVPLLILPPANRTQVEQLAGLLQEGVLRGHESRTCHESSQSVAELQRKPEDVAEVVRALTYATMMRYGRLNLPLYQRWFVGDGIQDAVSILTRS